MDVKNPKKVESDESVVLLMEPNDVGKVSTSVVDSEKIQSTGKTYSAIINNRKDSTPLSRAFGQSEANNNDDDTDGNRVHAGINGGTNEDELETNLEKDYEKDYQTVLKLKQQMERNESNPLRKSRRSIFSSLSMPKKPKECKLLAFVILLFALIIVGLVVIYHFHEEDFYFIYRGPNIIVNEKTLDVAITNAKGKRVLVGHMWRSRPSGKLPYDCSEVDLDGHGLCLLWKRLERLEIRQSNEDNATCYDVKWLALSSEVTQCDCFELGDAHWYGGGNSINANEWPLEKSKFTKRPFISGTIHDSNGFGPVLERYWLSSKGVAIIVKENSPLHVSINSFDSILNKTDGQLCIYSDYHHTSTYPNNVKGVGAGLNYTICIADNVHHVHSVALSKFGAKRPNGPPVKLFTDPVWSTWSYFKENYNQSVLENYATEITSNGFRHGLLMIDDGWEAQYGDMAFVTSKFHNPKQMIHHIQEMGFQVSLCSHPQLSTNSMSFQQATLNGYLVTDVSGDVPGLTRWWNGPRSVRWIRGVAGVIDMSTNASSWQRIRLGSFKTNYNVDSLHFVGGEVLSLPAHPTFDGAFLDPNEYTRRNAELSSTFGNLVSIRSAYRCQHLPILIRLGDGTSTWNETGGIETIIPTILTMGLIGYPFFVPDAIGGSAYNEMPSTELYIRWLQLSAFLPIMHFSIPPYFYDNVTAALAKEMLQLHDNLVVPEVTRVMDEAIENLTPIIRPIWWKAPTDEEALKSSTQFLVGDHILVAPVVAEGARQRDIYLPEGLWEDRLNGNVIHFGPKWLLNYEVPLDKVPHFLRRDA